MGHPKEKPLPTTNIHELASERRAATAEPATQAVEPRSPRGMVAAQDDPVRRERQRQLEELRHETVLWRKDKERRGKPWGDIAGAAVPEEEILDTISDLPDPDDDDLYLRYLREQYDPEKIGLWLQEHIRAGVTLVETPPEEEGLRRHLPLDVDPHELSEARWGLVCRRRDADMLRAQLKPLLELRRKQQRREVKIFFREGNEPASAFLIRHGETGGVIDPKKLPYYLLIAGDPDTISFDFQYHLSVDRAVGRVAFDDPADYFRYAKAVEKAETKGSALDPTTTIFSVENEGDTTALHLKRYLSQPLFERLDDYAPGWEIELVDRRKATKGRLKKLLSGKGSPGLFLASCHGAAVAPELDGGRFQRLYQGALMCQREADGRDRVFGASDVAPDADLTGLIAVLFACYGAGTPVLDSFPFEAQIKGEEAPSEPRALTDEAFVARLPQMLLSRGALATVGHVDRGLLLSFVWSVGGRAISTISSLEDALKRLLMGDRLGHAFRPLRYRAAALAARLTRLHERLHSGLEVDPAFLGEAWLSYNDARNFIILGDPAVYLLGQRRSGELIRLPKALADKLRPLARTQGEKLADWVLAVLEGKLR